MLSVDYENGQCLVKCIMYQNMNVKLKLVGIVMNIGLLGSVLIYLMQVISVVLGVCRLCWYVVQVFGLVFYYVFCIGCVCVLGSVLRFVENVVISCLFLVQVVDVKFSIECGLGIGLLVLMLVLM